MGSIVIRRGKQLHIFDVIQFFRKGVGSRES
jgi:hypothetical protein